LDTSRPSPRTNWTRLVRSTRLAAPGACALAAGAASGVALFRGAFWIAAAALLAFFAGSMSAATYLCSFPFKSAKVA
jgi:hypothetical protein